MVETVVAFSVLTAAILGPVALIIFSVAQAKSAQNKLIAVNLAQEGIELVRAIRENNVLCDTISNPPPVQWNDNPVGGPKLGIGGNNLYTVDANDFLTDSTAPQTLNCKASPSDSDLYISTPRPTENALCADTPLKMNPSGQYTYLGAGTATLFSRCVTICVPANSPPCNQASDPDLDVGHESDQMELISTVYWTDGARPRTLTFRERLYNWR